MNKIKTIVLFATALIAVLAITGSAQAVEPVAGQVNRTDAEGQIVTLYLDINPSDYVTTVVQNNASGGIDAYYFSDIEPLLNRNGINTMGQTFNVTVEMRCSGVERDINQVVGNPYTNTLRNTTPSTAKWTGIYDGYAEIAPLMELEPCVECSIDVNKTVWDPVNQRWEPNLLSGEVGKDYRFRCEIHNDGFNANLTNIIVWDVLDSSFVYNDSAMLEFPKGSGNWMPIDPPDSFWTDANGRTHIDWNSTGGALTGIILHPCETIVIEFNATLISPGTDCNVQYASAECMETGQTVEDSDEVCVSTTLLEVNKTVWSKPVGAPDYNAGQWVDEVTDAKIGDVYKFNCTIHNIGDPGQAITKLEVWDVLSDSLEYADNATLKIPDGTTRSINPPTESNKTYAKWVIDDFLPGNLTLLPCQSITIEFDARVVNYGRDENVQYAKGYCDNLSMWFEGSDDAWIHATEPDLIVSDITINYDASSVENKAIGPVPHPGNLTQSNNISADITELKGVKVEFPFNVTFEVNGEKLCTVEVPAGMNGLSTVTVYCDNKFFPLAGVKYNISVTADADNAIIESNESNNMNWNNVTAQWLGYKGNHYQDGRYIDTWKFYDQDKINLTYSLGDSYYLSAKDYPHWTEYEVNWTADNFSIPSVNTWIKDARLYVYYCWDKTPGKNITDYLDLTFNDVSIPISAKYFDLKEEGSGTNVGMVAYDVKNVFKATSSNNAKITNSYPGGGKVCMAGMLLVVVYYNPDEPERIIWINEGTDFLWAKSKYGVSPEEATAYARFNGAVPLSILKKAKLIAVAPWGNKGDDKNRLYFNDGMWKGAWTGYAEPTQVSIAEVDVLPYLKESDNVAAYQDRGDFMAASNAFLVLEKAGRKSISVEPEETIVQPQDQFEVDITLDTHGCDVYAVQYTLKYDPSVLKAESQVKGDFFGDADTVVVVNKIDHPKGIVEYAETLKGEDACIRGGKGSLAKIEFTAIGEPGATSGLNISGVIIVDCNKTENIYFVVHNGTVKIFNNTPPVIVYAGTKHEKNNAQKKFECWTTLCVNVTDDDTLKGYNISYIRWSFGDGQYGTAEGGLPCNGHTGCCLCKNHSYISWKYNASGRVAPRPDHHGRPHIVKYDPFIASVTVTDDGCPPKSTTKSFEVWVFMTGDANGDGVVNILDAVWIGKHFGQTCEGADTCCGYMWSSNQLSGADLNNDCKINILDAVIVGTMWGHTAY